MTHRRQRTQEQFLCFLTVVIHILSSLRPVLKGKPLRGGCFPLARNLRTVFAILYFFTYVSVVLYSMLLMTQFFFDCVFLSVSQILLNKNI